MGCAELRGADEARKGGAGAEFEYGSGVDLEGVVLEVGGEGGGALPEVVALGGVSDG